MRPIPVESGDERPDMLAMDLVIPVRPDLYMHRFLQRMCREPLGRSLSHRMVPSYVDVPPGIHDMPLFRYDQWWSVFGWPNTLTARTLWTQAVAYTPPQDDEDSRVVIHGVLAADGGRVAELVNLLDRYCPLPDEHEIGTLSMLKWLDPPGAGEHRRAYMSPSSPVTTPPADHRQPFAGDGERTAIESAPVWFTSADIYRGLGIPEGPEAR